MTDIHYPDDAIDRIEAFLASWDEITDGADLIIALARSPGQLRRSDLLAVLGAAKTAPRADRVLRSGYAVRPLDPDSGPLICTQSDSCNQDALVTLHVDGEEVWGGRAACSLHMPDEIGVVL